MDYFWYFLFYSFCGFWLEVLFARATGARKRDRKCRLFLPLCPVYGWGAAAILLLPRWVQARPVLLFLAGGAAATAVEYILSLFYEKVWHVRFWDYSALPWNVGGRVCLWFSGVWGLLSLGLVYWVQPYARALAAALPPELAFPCALVLAVDGALTGAALRQRGTDALAWYR